MAKTGNKSPELLASYIDQLLKKSNKDTGEDSVETALNQGVSSGYVFPYFFAGC